MPVTLIFVLHLLALFLFVAAGLAVPSRFNLTALGLALWMLAIVLG